MSFQDIYTPGDMLWYVNINYLTGSKELCCGHVRTLYDHVLILTDEEDCSSHMISISELDMLFADERSAREYMNSVSVTAKFGGKR